MAGRVHKDLTPLGLNECTRAAAATTTINSILEHTNLKFHPIIDNITYIQNANTARAMHNIANFPVMAGTNDQEGLVPEIGQNNITAFLQSTFGNS